MKYGSILEIIHCVITELTHTAPLLLKGPDLIQLSYLYDRMQKYIEKDVWSNQQTVTMVS